MFGRTSSIKRRQQITASKRLVNRTPPPPPEAVPVAPGLNYAWVSGYHR
jgi:hypothetical protein